MCEAQYNDLAYYREGERLFAKKDYHAASAWYEKYLVVDRKARPMAQPFAVQKIGHQTGNPRVLATCHLAISYLQMHDFVQSEKYWLKAAKYDRREFPEYLYWYGRTLMGLGKYEEATRVLGEFEKEYDKMGSILQDADLLLADLRFIQDQLRLGAGDYRLARVNDPRFTTAYAMGIHGEDSSYFTGVENNRDYTNHLFVKRDGLGGSSWESGVRKEKGAHEGLASFTPDGSVLFFTRWKDSAGVRQASIWSRKFKDGTWGDAMELGASVNLADHSSTQPFVTADGKYMLFASDRPGGYGGYDIWFADLDSNYEVIAAHNLGAAINTAGDEQCPYYHHRNHILVFASNGRIGMGGYDLYYAKGYFNLFRWEEPVNPGRPLNSPRDDMYFYGLDEDNLFNRASISSDRDSGCCLVLYNVEMKNHQSIAGQVIDSLTGKPLANVNMEIRGGKGRQVLATVHTDSLGRYRFGLSNTSRFRMHLTREGYDALEQDYIVSLSVGEDSIHNEPIYMRNPSAIAALIAARAPGVLGNWPYKTSALPVEVRHRLDSVATVLMGDSTASLEISGYTDGIGGEEYNLRLAQGRVDACLKYLEKKGIARERMHGKSMGKCCPVAAETVDGKDNPAGREVNRRVEYRVVRG